jgi:hypothetical protein
LVQLALQAQQVPLDLLAPQEPQEYKDPSVQLDHKVAPDPLDLPVLQVLPD